MGFFFFKVMFLSRGETLDVVRVLVMSLFRARWCGSPTGPKCSFIVTEFSRKGGGIHLNYTVGSQAKM